MIESDWSPRSCAAGVRSQTPGGRERTCLRRKRGSSAGLLPSEMGQGSHGDAASPHLHRLVDKVSLGLGQPRPPRPEGTESHIHDFPQIILVIPARHRWHLHAHITVGNHRGLPSHLILFFTGMWLRFPFTCQRAGSVPLGAHTSPTMHQETEVCLELVSLDSRATPAPAAPGTPPPRGVAGGGLCPLHRVDRMFLECSTISTPLPL